MNELSWGDLRPGDMIATSSGVCFLIVGVEFTSPWTVAVDYLTPQGESVALVGVTRPLSPLCLIARGGVP
jgi:hypothetical protein